MTPEEQMELEKLWILIGDSERVRHLVMLERKDAVEQARLGALGDLEKMLKRENPICGHKLGDLLGGDGVVTKCGACLQAKQQSKVEPTPGPTNTARPAWRTELERLREIRAYGALGEAERIRYDQLRALDTLRRVVESGQGEGYLPMELHLRLGLSRVSPSPVRWLGRSLYLMRPSESRNHELDPAQVLSAIDAAGAEICGAKP